MSFVARQERGYCCDVHPRHHDDRSKRAPACDGLVAGSAAAYLADRRPGRSPPWPIAAGSRAPWYDHPALEPDRAWIARDPDGAPTDDVAEGHQAVAPRASAPKGTSSGRPTRVGAERDIKRSPHARRR